MMLVAGFGMMQGMAASNTIIQTLVSEDKRGRVMSYYTMAFVGMAPFGSLLAGGAGARHRRAAHGHGQRRCLHSRSTVVLVAARRIRREMRPIYERLGIVPQPNLGNRRKRGTLERVPEDTSRTIATPHYDGRDTKEEAGMGLSEDLERIALQERELVLPRLDAQTAWELGARLRTMADERGLAVVIDVRRFGQPLFYAALEGTTPDNVEWVRRKSNVVARFHRSSYAVGLQEKAEERDASTSRRACRSPTMPRMADRFRSP